MKPTLCEQGKALCPYSTQGWGGCFVGGGPARGLFADVSSPQERQHLSRFQIWSRREVRQPGQK